LTCIVFIILIFFFLWAFVKTAFRNGLKQGEALSPLLFNCALEYTVRRVQVNSVLKLNGTHQLLVYADGLNTLSGSVHSIEKNTEALFSSC
jgi:uncharacterized membrane protein